MIYIYLNLKYVLSLYLSVIEFTIASKSSLDFTADLSPSHPFQAVHPNGQVEMPCQPRTEQLEIFHFQRPVDGHIHQDRQEEEGNALFN